MVMINVVIIMVRRTANSKFIRTLIFDSGSLRNLRFLAVESRPQSLMEIKHRFMKENYEGETYTTLESAFEAIQKRRNEFEFIICDADSAARRLDLVKLIDSQLRAPILVVLSDDKTTTMAVKDWARDGTCYYVATPMNSEDVMMIPLLVAMSLDQTTARLFDRVGRPPTDPYDNAIELSIQLVDVMRKMSTLGVVSNGGYWFDQYYHQIVEPIVDHFRCEPSRNPSNDERRSETAAARNDNDESPLGASARQFERVGRPQIRSLDQHLEILTEESDGGFWFDNYFHRMRQCYPISRNECDRDLIPA